MSQDGRERQPREAIWCAFDQITAAFSEAEHRALSHDRAARIYLPSGVVSGARFETRRAA